MCCVLRAVCADTPLALTPRFLAAIVYPSHHSHHPPLSPAVPASIPHPQTAPDTLLPPAASVPSHPPTAPQFPEVPWVRLPSLHTHIQVRQVDRVIRQKGVVERDGGQVPPTLLLCRPDSNPAHATAATAATRLTHPFPTPVHHGQSPHHASATWHHDRRFIEYSLALYR